MSVDFELLLLLFVLEVEVKFPLGVVSNGVVIFSLLLGEAVELWVFKGLVPVEKLL